MTDSAHAPVATANPAEMIERVGRSPGWTIALGALTVAAGILVLVWPGRTVAVVAVLLGLHLLVSGVFHVVAALAIDEAKASGRLLLAMVGVLSILVGILCLREPLQAVTVLALLLGLYWLATGIIVIFQVITDRAPAQAWAIASGVVGVIGGIVVLVYPGLSLAALAWLLGVLLVAHGIVVVIRGIASRYDPGMASAPPPARPS